MIKYVINIIPAPVNVFTGGWYTILNPVASMPSVGSGQNFRTGSRIRAVGFDFIHRLVLTAFGGGFPVNVRIIFGLYRKLDSNSFSYVNTLTNSISSLFNAFTGPGTTFSMNTPIVSPSNCQILIDKVGTLTPNSPFFDLVQSFLT